MSLLSSTNVLLGKELRTEFRSRELLTTTVVFILMVIVLFSFTFDPTYTESRRFGPGLLWLAFLFAASLMLQPCFPRQAHRQRPLSTPHRTLDAPCFCHSVQRASVACRRPAHVGIFSGQLGRF